MCFWVIRRLEFTSIVINFVWIYVNIPTCCQYFEIMTHELGFADNVGNLLTHVLLTMLESDMLTNLPNCFACLHFFYWSTS